MVKDVLVFTPVLRLEPETVRSIFALEWAGALSFLLQRDNPTGNPYRDHLHQYQRGREAFLASSYDSLLIVESDVILPKDALQRLAALECDLAYGCYLYRDGQVVNVLERYKDWPEPVRNPGESLSIRHLWHAAQQKGVIDCSGGGLGCILISRSVIEQMPFDDKYTFGGKQFFDFPWTCAVYDAGYRMIADCDVQCGHIDRDGTELWLARAK
jgi:hypothetical protein